MFALPQAASAIAAAAPQVAANAARAAMVSTLKSVAFNVLTSVAISSVLSALQPQTGASGRTFEWTLDPDGPIPFAAGRVGVAGSAVYRETFGSDLMYYGIPSVISGAGPIDGFEAFLADDESVTFDGTGKAVSSQYAGELWYKTSLGAQPSTAITSPSGLKSGAALPGWTSAHKLSGKASYMIVMGENSKGTAFPTGEIKPLVTVRGLKGWDPRKDSSYPGGSGSCRLNSPSTWVYLQNPILWALKWSLGLWEGPTGKGAPQIDYQVGGIGAKLSGIDVPAFVSAANVADANGWTVAAYPTTDDDKAQVLDAFLQAGGATYAQRAGKISCIQRAAPRTSIVTISGRDTAGPLEIDTAASRIDRINTIRPRYWSEAHRWQLTALPEVTASAYQSQDGGKRTRGIDYPYVTNPVQAAQLAALQIANTREGIAGVIPLKPHLQRIRPGDAFTITEEDFVLNGVKCLCLNTDYDPATGIVRVSFVSETDAKYPFALGQSPDVPAPQVLEPVDTRYVSPPAPEDWTVVVTPPGPGGTLPGLDLTGDVANATADAMLISWRVVAEGEDPDTPPAFFVEVEGEEVPTGPKVIAPGWVDAGIWPPTTQNLTLQGPQPGSVVWLVIRYKRGSNVSDPSFKGPLTVGALIAGGIAPDSADWDIIRDTITESEDRSAVALAAAQAQLEAADAAAAVALSIADTRLTGAVAGLGDAIANLDLTDIDGFAAYQTNVQTLLDGKASNTTVSLLQTQTNGLSSRLVTAEQAITDLPNNYASASVVGLLKSEVEGARNGSASLSAQLGTMRTAVTDGLAGKASASDLTSLTTRVTTAEGINTAQNARLSTVETDVAGKASATDLTTLQAEITSARSGSASLLARLVLDRTAVTDGLAGKASTSALTSLSATVDARPKIYTGSNAAGQPQPPGPRVIGDQWIVTNDGNKPFVWSGSAWVDNSDGRVAALLGTTSTLSANYTAQQIAISDLQANKASTSSVTALESSVSVRNRTWRQASQPTNPMGGYALVAGDRWINTTAGLNNEERVWSGSAWLDVTDPRVATSAQGVLDITAKIGTFSGTVADALAGKAAATDLTNLTTRVSTAEGVNTAQNTRLATAESDIAGKASSSTVTAISAAVDARPKIYTGSNASGQPQPPGPRVIGDQWIVTNLQNRPFVWNGTAWIDNSDGRVSDLLTTTSALSANYTSQQSAIADLQTGKASSTSVTTLTARVGTAEGNISTVQGVAADALGKASAIWGVTFDVNGYASGFKSVNDGTKSSFDVLADAFSIRATGTAARTEFVDGIWYAYDSTNLVRSSWGRPHGASGHGLTWWTGPNGIAKGSELKSNAYVYISMNSTGGPRFGGTDVPTGGGDLTSNSNIGQTKAGNGYSSIAGSGWQSLSTVTLTGVTAGELIVVSQDFGIPNTSGGTFVGEWQLVEGATVIAGPESLTITNGAATDPISANAFAVGSGSRTYTLQARQLSGGTLLGKSSGGYSYARMASATSTNAGLMSPTQASQLAALVAGGGGGGGVLLATTAPPTLGTANAVGTGTTAARSDHVHAHGNQAGGSLHAVATTAADGFLSAADKVLVNTISAKQNATGSTPLQVGVGGDNVRLVGSGTTSVPGYADFFSDGVRRGFAGFKSTSTNRLVLGHDAPWLGWEFTARPVWTGFTPYDTGNLSNATTGVAGLQSAADKSKLDGIATAATANATDAALRARSSHTGTQTLATISDAGTAAAKNASTTAVNGTLVERLSVSGNAGGIQASDILTSRNSTQGAIFFGATSQYIFQDGTNFTFTRSCTAPAFTPTSDIRLKKDFENVASGALDRVLSMQPIDFTRIADNVRARGFAAQSLQLISSRYVVEPGMTRDVDGNFTFGFLSIDPVAILADAVGAIKEQAVIIDDLRTALADLASRFEAFAAGTAPNGQPEPA